MATEHTPNNGTSLHARATRATDSVAWDLNDRFRRRLCSLVTREMNEIYRQRVEPEEIVQSVFATYFRRMENGEYTFEDTDHLWYLLKKIAANKLRKRIEYECADKRDVRREASGDDGLLDLPEPAQCRLFETAVANLLNDVDSPIREIFEFQLLGYDVADAIAYLLDGLSDLHVEVLRLRLQGMTQNEIADQLQYGRTVVRNCLCRLQQRAGRVRDHLMS